MHGPARKFPPEVTTLAGFAEPTTESLEALAQLLQPEEVVGLFLHQTVKMPAGLSILHELPLVQMWHGGRDHRWSYKSLCGVKFH